MVTDLARNWWLIALRGVVGILFGIGAFVWPGVTLAALVLVFGAYVFVDGVFTVAAGVRMRRQRDFRWLMLLEGAAGIFLGILTFVQPGITALVLVSFIAAWSLITGGLEVVAAVHLRKSITNEWLLILSGVASVAFGILLIVFPGPGALSLVWFIGSYVVAFGFLNLGLSFRLRGLQAGARPRATGAV